MARKIIPTDANSRQGKYLALAQKVKKTMKVDDVLFLVTKTTVILKTMTTWVYGWFYLQGSGSSVDVIKGLQATGVNATPHKPTTSLGGIIAPLGAATYRCVPAYSAGYVGLPASLSLMFKSYGKRTVASRAVTGVMASNNECFSRDLSTISFAFSSLKGVTGYSSGYMAMPWADTNYKVWGDPRTVVRLLVHGLAGDPPFISLTPEDEACEVLPLALNYTTGMTYEGNTYIPPIHQFAGSVFCVKTMAYEANYVLSVGQNEVRPLPGFLMTPAGRWQLAETDAANSASALNTEVLRTVSWVQETDIRVVNTETHVITDIHVRVSALNTGPFYSPKVREETTTTSSYTPSGGSGDPVSSTTIHDVRLYPMFWGNGENIGASGTDVVISQIAGLATTAAAPPLIDISAYPPAIEVSGSYPQRIGIFSRSLKGTSHVADLGTLRTGGAASLLPPGTRVATTAASALLAQLAANPIAMEAPTAACAVGPDYTGAFKTCAATLNYLWAITLGPESGTTEFLNTDTRTCTLAVKVFTGDVNGVTAVRNISVTGTPTNAGPANINAALLMPYATTECAYVGCGPAGAYFNVNISQQVFAALTLYFPGATLPQRFVVCSNGDVIDGARAGADHYHDGCRLDLLDGSIAALNMNTGNYAIIPGWKAVTGVGKTRSICAEQGSAAFSYYDNTGSGLTLVTVPAVSLGGVWIFNGSSYTPFTLETSPYPGHLPAETLNPVVIEGDIAHFTISAAGKVISRYALDMVAMTYKVFHVRGAWHTDVNGIPGANESATPVSSLANPAASAYYYLRGPRKNVVGLP